MTQNDQPVRFEPRGTVACTVAGDRYRLRRPTIGEMRRLREDYAVAEDDVLEAADPHRAELHALRERIGELRTVDATDDDLAEARRLKREARDIDAKIGVAMEAARARWIRSVFAELADRQLPEPGTDDPADGLEPWLLGGDFAVQLFGHWRTVPKDSGGNPTGMELTLP